MKYKRHEVEGMEFYSPVKCTKWCKIILFLLVVSTFTYFFAHFVAYLLGQLVT